MGLYRVGNLLDGLLKRDVCDRKLVFLGLGSLGGFLANNLMVYPWREVVFIDPDTLSIENVERHPLGSEFCGVTKVKGMFELAVRNGADPHSIIIHQGYAEDYLDQHTDADLILVNVDNRQSKSNINNWCFQYGIPALYGGVYPKGTGGDVTYIPNPVDVCFECADFMQGGTWTKPKPNYGVELVPVTQESTAVPALRWAVNSISCDMAGLALEILKGGEVPAQILVHIHDWDSVFELTGSEQIGALAQFIAAEEALGLVPNNRLSVRSSGEFSWLVQRQYVPMTIKRWEDCPYHVTESNSADEI